MKLRVRPARRLEGTVGIPGDKSISHRALILGALAQGKTRVQGFLPGADCLATLACLEALGVRFQGPVGGVVFVEGRGCRGFRAPDRVLDAQNSGTTMRLLLGVLAGQPFTATLTGDDSLRWRPMGRVTRPLRQMGARIEGREGGEYAPLTITGGSLVGITYDSPVASAQVKSALLLAGLAASGTTRVREPALSRDHTERMLAAFGVKVERDGLMVSIAGGQVPVAREVMVPGDISSAAFLVVAGLLAPRGRIRIPGVGINPTRTGFLEVLTRAGAEIEVENPRETSGEPVADLLVSPSVLRAFTIQGDLIPRLVDEIPILALAATQAMGTTRIRDARELRVKESDRLRAIARGLRALGAEVEETDDGLDIHGPTQLKGTVLCSYGDHRIAMTWTIAGLIARGETVVEGAECIDVSFPGFARCLAELGADIS